MTVVRDAVVLVPPYSLIIITQKLGFVNIHFVRFFVVIFGEKYRVKNLRAFVVVLFVDFLQCLNVVVKFKF